METLISFIKWINRNKDKDNMDTRIMSRYTKYWWASGMWPIENDKSYWFPYIYPRFVIGLLCFNLLLYTYSIFVKGNSFISATEQAFIILFVLMGLMKTATHVYQPMELKEMCRDLEILHEKRLGEGIPAVKAILCDSNFFSLFCSAYLPISGTITGIIAMLLLVAVGFYTRKPLFSAQYPCDVTSSPCLELTILHDVVLSFTCVHCIGLADAFFLDIMNQVWAEAKILNFNLKNIRQYAAKKVDDKAERSISSGACKPSRSAPKLQDEAIVEVEARRVSSLKLPRKVNLSQRSRSREKTDVKAIITWADAKAKIKAARRLAIEKEMALRLAECVRHHQTILSLTDNLQSVYNPFLLSQLSNNLLESAIIAVHIIIVPHWGVKELGMIIIELLICTQFFMFSWLSNGVTSECSKVKKAVFGSDWLEATDSFKRSMRIIMSRANERVVIRVGGSIPLSLESYYRISKSAVSHFLAMRTIVNKQ